MRMVLVIAAVMSIDARDRVGWPARRKGSTMRTGPRYCAGAFGLVAVAVGRAWYDFRPLTDEERARLRQEGN